MVSLTRRNMGYLRRMRGFLTLLTVACAGGAIICLAVGHAAGQNFRHVGTEFEAKRAVTV